MNVTLRLHHTVAGKPVIYEKVYDWGDVEVRPFVKVPSQLTMGFQAGRTVKHVAMMWADRAHFDGKIVKSRFEAI